eukprot:3474234-Rhodomonas_salina.2
MVSPSRTCSLPAQSDCTAVERAAQRGAEEAGGPDALSESAGQGHGRGAEDDREGAAAGGAYRCAVDEAAGRAAARADAPAPRRPPPTSASQSSKPSAPPSKPPCIRARSHLELWRVLAGVFGARLLRIGAHALASPGSVTPVGQAAHARCSPPPCHLLPHSACIPLSSHHMPDLPALLTLVGAELGGYELCWVSDLPAGGAAAQRQTGDLSEGLLRCLLNGYGWEDSRTGEKGTVLEADGSELMDRQEKIFTAKLLAAVEWNNARVLVRGLSVRMRGWSG